MPYKALLSRKASNSVTSWPHARQVRPEPSYRIGSIGSIVVLADGILPGAGRPNRIRLVVRYTVPVKFFLIG